MLSIVERVLFLKTVKYFDQIPGEELAPIAAAAQEIEIPADEQLITQGDLGNCLYIIVEGNIDIVLDDIGHVATRGEKSVIGEMSLLTNQRRTGHCIANTDVKVLKIEHDDFRNFIADKPDLALGIIDILVQSLQAANQRLRQA